jgi:hypothetical protein
MSLHVERKKISSRLSDTQKHNIDHGTDHPTSFDTRPDRPPYIVLARGGDDCGRCRVLQLLLVAVVVVVVVASTADVVPKTTSSSVVDALPQPPQRIGVVVL